MALVNALGALALEDTQALILTKLNASIAVTGPLTDTQLRASAIAVTGPLTDAQLRASAVPVSGPLTDAQLRATAVPVSVSGTVTVTGGLTDTQLRATAVPVSVSNTVTVTGPLTDTQLRATAVPVSSAQLPSSLGPLTSANSLSVTPGTDAVFKTGNNTVQVSANFSRPADTTQYAIGDLVANNVTAGSVTPLSLTGATRVAAGSAILRRLRLQKSGVSTTSAAFRVHLWRSSPTSSAGDNAAFATNNAANYLGKVDITVDQSFSDGSVGFSDVSMGDIQFQLASGTAVYALLEARATYTPATGETFTLIGEFLQD